MRPYVPAQADLLWQCRRGHPQARPRGRGRSTRGGIRLDDRSCAADSDGYQPLITWAERHGRVAAFGIEGTGSYGAGLARAVGPGGPIDRHPEDRGRGAVEMMRHLKVARRTAVNARTSAMITLKQIVVPRRPRGESPATRSPTRCSSHAAAGWRCGTIDTPTASAKQTLRALARRWFALSVEIVDPRPSPGSTHHPDLADAA